MATPPMELLSELNEYVRRAQRIMAEWTDPRGLTDDEARDRLSELLEGPELLALQAQVAETVNERMLFFAITPKSAW